MRWFAAWAVAGALCTFSVVAVLSFGVFVFPLALVALFWVGRRAPSRAAIGFVAGIGAILLLVAFVNRDGYTACPSGGLEIPAGAPPGTSVSCGGLDPRPWAIAGIAVTGAALLGYGFARKR